MVCLITVSKIISQLPRVGVTSMKALSTRAMPSVKDETKEVIIKYLDGKDNGIAVLGLNRPSNRNAIGKNLASQLSEAIGTIREDNKVRVVIFRSLVPKAFCAGADLRERLKMNTADVPQFVSFLRGIMNDVESLPTPVISAIDGIALGGGLELALATDIRIAASEAKMGLVETKLAIIPGGGGTQRLPRIVGVAKAKELIYTSRILDGDEAAEIRLVNQSVPQNKNGDAAYQAALSVAREILPNGPIGIKLAKVAIGQGIEMSIEDGMEVEKQCYNQLMDTKDRLEGLAAFTAKRVPIYRGV